MAEKLTLKTARIGKINYVNTVPFYYGLFDEESLPSVVEGTPAEMNRAMREGVVDFKKGDLNTSHNETYNTKLYETTGVSEGGDAFPVPKTFDELVDISAYVPPGAFKLISQADNTSLGASMRAGNDPSGTGAPLVHEAVAAKI